MADGIANRKTATDDLTTIEASVKTFRATHLGNASLNHNLAIERILGELQSLKQSIFDNAKS